MHDVLWLTPEASEMSANSWDKFRRLMGKSQDHRTLGGALDRREAAEQALNLSQRQLRILIESVTDCAIYMLDANGHVTSWNAGAEKIFGYSSAEMIGKPLSILIPQEASNEELEIQNRIRAGETCIAEGPTNSKTAGRNEPGRSEPQTHQAA